MAAITNSDTILVYPNETKKGYPLHVEYTEIDPGKKNVILLHGYMGSIRDYTYIINWLSDNYNILAIDLRGHGLSGMPDEEFHDTWTIASLADDIRTVVTSILSEDAKISIVASSLSTAISMEFTNRYPDVVEKLFLISPTQVLDIPMWGRLLLQIEKMTPTAITKFLISLTTRLVPAVKLNAEERNISKDLYGRVRHLNVKSHQKILRETVKSWKIDISSITHPVLIVAGEFDKIVPVADSVELNK
ncbi:MAG: alpha/beta fold hydrolase, partial [Candidatus Kariarchaeaceae archaeon]